MSAQTFNQALEALFAKKLKARMNELGVQIAQGKMPTFEQYKYHCGIVAGLNEALEAIGDTMKELQKAERGENG